MRLEKQYRLSPNIMSGVKFLRITLRIIYYKNFLHTAIKKQKTVLGKEVSSLSISIGTIKETIYLHHVNQRNVRFIFRVQEIESPDKGDTQCL